MKLEKDLKKDLYVKMVSDIDFPRRVTWSPAYPGVWNSVCYVSNGSHINIFQNSLKVAELSFPSYLQRDKNFLIFGGIGDFTDFKIWKKTFTEEDIIKWDKFELVSQKEYLAFDWKTSVLKMNGFKLGKGHKL